MGLIVAGAFAEYGRSVEGLLRCGDGDLKMPGAVRAEKRSDQQRQ